ncbi:MAG: outer membrane protein assembly factor BamD [Kofleriaceae bacterium]
MTDDDLLASLVAADKRTPDPSPADAARVWSGIATKLPGPGGGGSGSALGLKAAIGGLAAIGVVVAVVATQRPKHHVIVEEIKIVDAGVVTPPPAPPPDAAIVVVIPVPPKKVKPPVDAAPAVEVDTEDMVIERAKVALARAQFDEALKLLSEHEKRFPQGPMRSERELLIVRALLGTSDRKAAVEHAERLRQANPRDPALPAIDAALAK